MTTDLFPAIGARAKLAPAWVENLDPDKWISSVGWVRDGIMTVPTAAASPGSTIHILLTQRDGHWIALANSPAGWFLFEPLSFMAMWNEAHPSSSDPDIDAQPVELFVDVSSPFVLRHPSLIPMEVSFDHSTNRFQRSVIYSLFPIADRKD